MLATDKASNVTAPTQFLTVKDQKYAYRRFGSGKATPLLFLQHFTGTLDNWDPAVTDPLAQRGEVILFESAGLGRSSGKVPDTLAGMAKHALAFLDALGLDRCDVVGFSLGGMVAQQMVLDRPSIFGRIILVGTAPRGGEDIMHLEKPRLSKFLQDPSFKGYGVLQKIFFDLTPSSQAAGEAFINRLMERKGDREPVSGGEVAQAQMMAFREWEKFTGKRFGDLASILQPTLVVNGIHDEMIPIANSYWLVENLPNAVLLAYPDSGHGSLFQFNESFTHQAKAFLDSTSLVVPIEPINLSNDLEPSNHTQPKELHMIQKVEIERFSVISAKPFDEVVAGIGAGVGHPNMAEFWKSTRQAQSLSELEDIINKITGSSGLMQFEQLNHGAIIQADTGRTTRMLRLLIGNPLIMKEMAKRVPDAGSYAPVTVLVDERADGVHLSYDRMASFLAPYGNPDALAVARNLDQKVESLLVKAAA